VVRLSRLTPGRNLIELNMDSLFRKLKIDCMNTVLKIGGLGLLAVALYTAPEQLFAQSTNEAGASPKHAHGTNQVANTDKKPVAGPFHGKLLALDKVKKTIMVGKRTFQITSETKIKKGGKPATLEDGIVGDPVSGYVKPAEGGKWIAVSMNFGPKVQEGSAEPKKSKPDKEPN